MGATAMRSAKDSQRIEPFLGDDKKRTRAVHRLPLTTETSTTCDEALDTKWIEAYTLVQIASRRRTLPRCIPQQRSSPPSCVTGQRSTWRKHASFARPSTQQQSHLSSMGSSSLPDMLMWRKPSCLRHGSGRSLRLWSSAPRSSNRAAYHGKLSVMEKKTKTWPRPTTSLIAIEQKSQRTSWKRENSSDTSLVPWSYQLIYKRLFLPTSVVNKVYACVTKPMLVAACRRLFPSGTRIIHHWNLRDLHPITNASHPPMD